MREALEQACQKLAESGFVIDRIGLPPSFHDLPDATRTVNKFEGARFHRERFERFGERIGLKLAQLVGEGLAIPENRYQQAREKIFQAGREYREVSARCSVWVTPAAPGPAPRGLNSTGDPRCNLPFTALGVPALTIPCGLHEGLPLGLQFTAPRNEEGLLLSTAVACEKVLRAG
jgi:Asp-tRNA(Asn)/Glu-tRNA(Gln) amidotransferase A subunit family amidase